MVLVDEYDEPRLDAIEIPQVARANRAYLGGLYGVIEASDAHVWFAFLTGGEHVLEGEPLRRAEPDRHHARSGVYSSHLRLHGGSPRQRVRAVARRGGRRYRARGTPVIVGAAAATLQPDRAGAAGRRPIGVQRQRPEGTTVQRPGGG